MGLPEFQKRFRRTQLGPHLSSCVFLLFVADDFPLRVANTGYEFLYGLARRAADGPDVVIRPVLQRVEHILQLLAELVDAVTGIGKVYADMSRVERLVLEVCGLQVALPDG